MNRNWSQSAREKRLIYKSHTAEAVRQAVAYEAFPQPTAGVESVIAKSANIVTKGIYGVLKVPDAIVHDIIDPNEPPPLLTGPMRRTRQQIGTTFNRVFSRNLIKKPIRTIGTAAYETIFETTQNLFVDIPETLSGNTSQAA